MNTVLWTLQGILAAIFLGAGMAKLVQSKSKLESKMAWVTDFASGHVKVIGILELIAATGLILPAALNRFPILTAWAAAGLMILMLGAALTHALRNEGLMIVPTVMLATTAAVAAWARFGPYPL